MSGRWFFVDGRLVELRGDHDDVIEQVRELRSYGSTVKAARTPKAISSREIASRAAQHRRR